MGCRPMAPHLASHRIICLIFETNLPDIVRISDDGPRAILPVLDPVETFSEKNFSEKKR